jgi:hypothetical protein
MLRKGASPPPHPPVGSCCCCCCCPFLPRTITHHQHTHHAHLHQNTNSTPQTATQIIVDFVEGALADVRAEFVEVLKRRGVQGKEQGQGGGGAAAAEAFYEENVAPVRVIAVWIFWGEGSACDVFLGGSGVRCRFGLVGCCLSLRKRKGPSRTHTNS